MNMLLLWVGRLAGIAGILVILIAVAMRARGLYAVGSYQAGTLLLVGIALMVLGCLAYLTIIAERATGASR
ncbi:MAG TPA: hypothetical protein VFC24_00725 [Casimicrobiaceae bacterium]|nr:hypothetical protein [Casimicrobiaceae bacterium]